jgi:hypothetical protein
MPAEFQWDGCWMRGSGEGGGSRGCLHVGLEGFVADGLAEGEGAPEQGSRPGQTGEHWCQVEAAMLRGA